MDYPTVMIFSLRGADQRFVTRERICVKSIDHAKSEKLGFSSVDTGRQELRECYEECIRKFELKFYNDPQKLKLFRKCRASL